MSDLVIILHELYRRFQDDEVTALGAQLTYYLLLAFFPFLVFIITLLSYTTMPDSLALSLNSLARFLPTQAYAEVENIVLETLNARSQTLLSLGMIFTLWAASNGVNAIIRGINKAYGEKETRPFWKVRGIALFFTIALALVILFALVMLVLGRIMAYALFKSLGATHLFTRAWLIVRYLFPLAVMLIVFIFFYKFSANRQLSLKEVLPGALFTTIGWILSSLAFSFYINKFSNFTRIYGSLGGIMILLLWLYLSSIIILVGGELNAVLRIYRIKQQ
ncbi:YihY/virulence factor BrkB family protein [Syntrophomonas erecta]